MREQLIRYLLGELDEDEHLELRAQLRDNPELQRELAHLRECFAINPDDIGAPLPPGRLAERTSERVTTCDEVDDFDWASSRADAMSSGSEPPAGVLGWSLADLTVAGGVMLAVSMLVFPALRDSRDGTRRTVCQSNQAQLGMFVSQFAKVNGGFIPPVRRDENAGVYVARLVGGGHVLPEEIAALLVCPASPVANEIRAGRLTIRVPDAEAIRRMSPEQLAAVTATLSPCYAYRFPYQVGGEYHYIRDDRRAHSPLLSDTSGDVHNPMSPNHGGTIIQILCQDGRVMTIATYKLPGFDEDVFHNDRGIVAAGIGRHDIVLGPSNAKPGLEFASRKK
jgi:anti-sigma factor RsiW